MNRTRTQRKTLWGIGDMLVIVWCLIPVVWLASLSFKDPATFGDGSFIPTRWTLANYRGIFQTSLFTRALVNSIGIALIATPLGVVVATSAAYAVARLRVPGKRVLLGATCWSRCSRPSRWSARCSPCGGSFTCSTPGPG
jgi:multiple sugar transport system permease protein